MHAIHPIAMAEDNYGWLILPEHQLASSPRPAIIIDPTLAQPVARALERHGAELRAICATHHHHDHTGGIAELAAQQAGPVPVVAGAADVAACRIPKATVALEDGVTYAAYGLTLRALHVPGHTLGSTALYSEDLQAVFSGDTLFAAGCGRLFEGDAAMMWRSMQALRALPPETRVCCGHEYTEKNLRFVLSLEPGHQAAARALARAQALRAQGQASVPTTLAEERAYNPFLRADDPDLMATMKCRDAVSTFAALRSARNEFMG